jgi:hypothetical protein
LQVAGGSNRYGGCSGQAKLLVRGVLQVEKRGRFRVPSKYFSVHQVAAQSAAEQSTDVFKHFNDD